MKQVIALMLLCTSVGFSQPGGTGFSSSGGGATDTTSLSLRINLKADSTNNATRTMVAAATVDSAKKFRITDAYGSLSTLWGAVPYTLGTGKLGFDANVFSFDATNKKWFMGSGGTGATGSSFFNCRYDQTSALTVFSSENGHASDNGGAAFKVITKDGETGAFMGFGANYSTDGSFTADAITLIANSLASGGLNLVARATSAPVRIYAGSYTNEVARFTSTGRLGIGLVSPTAVLHLLAGDTAASKAPLKFSLAGAAFNTTAERGAEEAAKNMRTWVDSLGVRHRYMSAPDTSKNYGSDAFSGTDERDAIYVPGSVATDKYFLQTTGATAPAATDFLNAEAKIDSLIVFRGAAGTSGLIYNWMRMR